MRLDPLVRDYPAFLQEFIDVLSAPTTRFYLDTSLLMWLIRIGSEARAEFFAWATALPAGTVRIPVWVAHELHRHLSANTVSANVRKTLGEVSGKYEEFLTLAAERADDRACRKSGFPSRVDYLTALRQSQAQFVRISKAVVVEDAELRTAAESVIAFVNAYMLETDLKAIMSDLSQVGQFRYDHRVPPGFHDNKDENRFGDLIIWEELVADMAAAAKTKSGGTRRRPLATHAVFISRDKKTDWVTAAQMVVTPDSRVIKSDRSVDMDVTLPHPLLLHEFRSRTSAEKVFITHPAFLATTLDLAARRAREPSPSSIWLMASHRPDLTLAVNKTLDQIAPPDVSAHEPPASPARLASAPEARELHATLAYVDWSGLDVKDLATISVTSQVAQYMDAVPADLPDVIGGFLGQTRSGALSPVAFGRLLAELSLAKAAGWPEQLPLVLEPLLEAGGDAAQQALLAFLTTAYFDRFGDLRARPRVELIGAGLIVEPDLRFAQAFSTLARLLQTADAKLPYVPSGERTRVRYSLDLGPSPAPLRICDIRIGSQSALLDQLPLRADRTLTILLSRTPEDGCTGEELRALLAREYMIPLDLLAADWDRRTLTWSSGAGLAHLDPFSEGGLSASAEFDGHD